LELDARHGAGDRHCSSGRFGGAAGRVDSPGRTFDHARSHTKERREIMRAITFSTYGGPDVLQLSEVPVPEPGPGQVRLSVRVAGVNPIDWKIRSGAMQQNFQVPFPNIHGLEVAGVVDAVGE